MRKDHKRDLKTAPKKLQIKVWPFFAVLVLFMFFKRDSLKEFFPGLRSEDVAKAALKEDMSIRHPITKLYFETYKFDGAQEFADEFWKKCEDNLNNQSKAKRCAEFVKNLIDREGSRPVIAKAITDHYCLERNFSPFCNEVYAYWKVDDSDYSLQILERSCKELEDKDGCQISQKIMD
ncbi:MAG: hypothetical protein EP319_18640 [Deltaproteobacteria bacterium]|nr:MAG: hypothetical protein EP319_18640 [Deltaproteobacteria bacterium]